MICSLISKRILDAIGALPCPIFQDRAQEYRVFLSDYNSEMNGPLGLLNALLDATIRHYEESLDFIDSVDFDHVCAAANENDLILDLQALGVADCDVAMDSWNALSLSLDT